MRNSIRTKLGLERREMLHQQRRQIPIFTQRKQIPLMQCIHVRFCVFVDDPVRNDDGTTFVCCAYAVERETSWKTRHGAEEGFESFREMMRDVVFVDLDHGPPRAFFVFEFGFAANTDDTRVVCTRGDEPV
jgi:hypothetical protein